MATSTEVEASTATNKDDVPTLPFAQMTSQFMQSVKDNFAANNVQGLEKTNELLLSKDKENKKLALDQCLREYQARELIIATKNNVEFDVIQKYVRFVVQAAQRELCTLSTPMNILGDVFDLLPLAKCETFFKIVELEVATWKSPVFYSSIKNHLLRICNDLLRRLSRTQNTVFCGRILLFLAKFFPFSERSGLNVISEFNLDNHTAYTKEPPKSEEKPKEDPKTNTEEQTNEDKSDKINTDDIAKESSKPSEEKSETTEDKTEKKTDKIEEMEIELIVEEKEKMEVEKKEDDKESKAEREFKLYSNFWQLQDFFRDPAQCYDKTQWDTFCNITAEIFATFTKKKLDSRAAKKEPHMKETADDFVEEYFPKYLTNQNLLNLQLNDSNFRRYVLMQYLIVFQYLQTSVKFKTESQVLSTDQGKWIDEQRKKSFKLLDETPPNGKAFSTSAKSILKRELIWIRWKNEGCPSLVIPSPPPAENGEAEKEEGAGKAKLGKRKAPLGDLMRYEAKHGKINLGNKGLTKLWNINPDNLEACKEQERNFLPSLLDFFGEPINELNPHNGIEDTYKQVNKGEWGWRALRLMSRRSNHFFLVGNSHISKLPEYLTIMMKKMATDFEINIEAPVGGAAEDEANGMETNGNGAEAPSSSLKLTEEQVSVLAGKLADHWEKLVPKFGLPDEKVEEIKSSGTNEEKCVNLLKAWIAEEEEGASPDEITYILGSLKLSQLIEGVF